MALGKTTKLIPALFFISVLQIFCSQNCSCIDTITYKQSITYSEFIVSPNKIYKLGFFSPVNTTNHYVGIMFSFRSTVVWVANRNKPLNDASGILTISENGNLVILNAKKELIWSSNVSSAVANSSARLLDTGNLVLQDDSNGKPIWESFKHPTDSLLPTMITSTNVKTGEKTWLTSWRSHSDPSIGSFSAGLSPLNIPQSFVWNGSSPSWRSGPWNGQIFIGIPLMGSIYDRLTIVDNEGNFETSFNTTYELPIYYVLNPDGGYQLRFQSDPNDDWTIAWSSRANECDSYGKCGPFGKCNPIDSPICSCLIGFEPIDREEWGQGNWSRGCKRMVPLKCDRNTTVDVDGDREERFLQLAFIKVPDFAERAPAIGDDNCRSQCMSNCSCIAYAYYNGVGCMLWSQSLIDIQEFPSGGTDLYIRLSYAEHEEKMHTTVVIAVTTVIGSITIAICMCLFWRWMAKQRGKKKARELLLLQRRKVLSKHSTAESIPQENLSHIKLEELPFFSFHKVANATNNFSLANKLGKGGFGLVYKGRLADGQEIAVKRLSRSSEQGLEEFMNEVILISKLQHRNLVRLLGICVEGEEKMLIYEYMPNGSLDTFLFDSPKQELVNWRKRVKIIEGIIRGLLYLHQDSRLRIIHRDLKTSNILLDKELNPKISDFGMARIFDHKQDQADTRRVVGTYGYMAPEYAMEGKFSEKSDIYGFGVLLLEIVCGRKNSSFYHDELSLSLVAFAWRLWNENRILTFIDSMIYESHFRMEILKYIHIGLLCVQESSKDRPTISTVLSMLNSDIADLASPKPPAYTPRQNKLESDLYQNIYSIDSVTNTIIEGR